MAFNPEPTRTPTAIGTMEITLATGSDDAPWQTARFEIVVELSDGTQTIRSGDLVPHISAAQRQGLMDFMAALRTQAETQIL